MASNCRRRRGAFAADFVICGTGIDMNFAGRRELRNCAANIATWADRYQPPTDERSPRLGRFPYLADDYALTRARRRTKRHGSPTSTSSPSPPP